MRKPIVILLLSGLAVAVVLAVFNRLRTGASSPEASLLPEGIGHAAADTASQLLGNQGRVLLILPQRRSFTEPATEVQRAAFVKALARHKGISLAATEHIEVERPGAMGAGGMDAGEFLQLVDRHADAGVVVSLADFPEFPPAAWAALKNRKFVVLGNANPQLKALLTAGVVQAALVPRPRPAAADVKPRTASDWFRSAYEVVTIANLHALP